jgi:hypothetical protein
MGLGMDIRQIVETNRVRNGAHSANLPAKAGMTNLSRA